MLPNTYSIIRVSSFDPKTLAYSFSVVRGSPEPEEINAMIGTLLTNSSLFKEVVEYEEEEFSFPNCKNFLPTFPKNQRKYK